MRARPGVPLLVVGSLAIAGLTLLLPSVPTTDPWGWIVWGRQVLHLDLNTVAGPPSWKPLPVLFTAPLSLLGGAAPSAWLVIARAGGILALALAFRLGARLAGPAAGAVAVLGLALSGGWLRGLAYGYTEGLAVALLLWAILSHMDGRRGRALVLAFLVSLSRPEAWAFLLPYAAFVAWKEPRLRLPAAAVAIGSPLLWILPDWWGSGQLFHASRVAGVNLSADGANPGLHVVRAGLGLISLPLELLAVAGLALAVRRRDRRVLLLGLGALAWILLLGVATEAHYPGAGRFLVPPVAIVCVLAGVGAAWLSQLAGRVAPQAALAVLLAAAVLPVLARADASADQAIGTHGPTLLQGDLDVALQQAGGPLAVLRCGQPVLPLHLWWNAGALAWKLDVPLDRIATVQERQLASLDGIRAPAVLFRPLARSVPQDPVAIPAQSPPPPGLRVRRLARYGGWSVLALEPKSHAPRACA
ncbi:MAG TPA: hypothetical protein VN606_12445 [Thermoleophilaceae bacterium]|nr:hypothetical protein [Thermoleophilaceae bacterium]